MRIPLLSEVPELMPGTLHDAPSLLLIERRQSKSDLMQASEILSHAVDYLVSEQLSGHRTPSQANRQAIAILNDALKEVVEKERRGATRGSIDAWIRNAALFWAKQN